MASGDPEGVLITGVYGSGKSSVAAEIGYELEQRSVLYALLDLDFLGWVGDHDTGRATMLRNLAAIAPNYRDLAVSRYVLAYFVPDRGTLEKIKDALAIPLRVVRLSVPFSEIERRLSADVISSRSDDLRDAAELLATSAGAGVEDLVIESTGPVREIAREVMSWLGWLSKVGDRGHRVEHTRLVLVEGAEGAISGACAVRAAIDEEERDEVLARVGFPVLRRQNLAHAPPLAG